MIPRHWALLGAAALAAPLAGANAFAGDSLSNIALDPGAFYFSVNGRQSFLLGRNPTGRNAKEFEPLFQWASESGETLLRIHVCTGIQPQAPAGEADEAWLETWSEVFTNARERGLFVLPVLSVWAQWNDGSDGRQWAGWERNPYNAALGGPARHPADLFRDSECQRLWLDWLEQVVRRWSAHDNLVAWEVFSELDLATGASEAEAVEFFERAAAAIRREDSRARPITASTAGVHEWPLLFRSPGLDIVQIHPYANPPRFHGDLDAMILELVRSRRQKYGKPVLIGESGLDARGLKGTLVESPRAPIGLANAIWAAAVSGAMAGRMLWWEDGYRIYPGVEVKTRSWNLAKPVARFVEDVNFAGMKPLAVDASDRVLGGALASENAIIGWFRDARCAAPDWPVRRLEGAEIEFDLPSAESEWLLQFFDTQSGGAFEKKTIRQENRRIRIALPAFQNSVALKMRAK